MAGKNRNPKEANIRTGGVATKFLNEQGVYSAPGGGDMRPQDFRLTLETGVPVSVADQTAKATVYCTPYVGNQIALYDGAAWNIRTSAEFSVGLGTITAALCYDVFCYDNAGTPTLEILAWTSATARATALAYQDGVLSKSGATTRRYLGTFYTTATTTTEDSLKKRFLYNYYHRVDKPIRFTDAATSWTYKSSTIRQANANAANKIEAVFGVSEDAVMAVLSVVFVTAALTDYSFGVGYDSITAYATESGINYGSLGVYFGSGATSFVKTPAIGYHYFAWLEHMASTSANAQIFGTNTFGISQFTGAIRG